MAFNRFFKIVDDVIGVLKAHTNLPSAPGGPGAGRPPNADAPGAPDHAPVDQNAEIGAAGAAGIRARLAAAERKENRGAGPGSEHAAAPKPETRKASQNIGSELADKNFDMLLGITDILDNLEKKQKADLEKKQNAGFESSQTRSSCEDIFNNNKDIQEAFKKWVTTYLISEPKLPKEHIDRAIEVFRVEIDKIDYPREDKHSSLTFEKMLSLTFSGPRPPGGPPVDSDEPAAGRRHCGP